MVPAGTRFYTFKRQVVLHAGQVVKFLKGKGYYAAAAAVIVIAGGGVVAGGCSCVIPDVGGGGTTITSTTTTITSTTTGGGSWTPVASANIEVNAATGNDSCTREPTASTPLTSGHICATWDKANLIAQNGDIIAVDGGTAYNGDGTNSVPLENDVSRTSFATFACGNSIPVTLNADQLWIDSQRVSIEGRCFQFQNVWVGDPANEFGAGKACSFISLDNVSMYEFDISGPCINVTISNSTIGPDIACYQPGSKAGATCQNNAVTNEQYFYNRGEPNTNFNEPKVHDGGSGGSVPPQQVLLQGDTFYGISARDPDGLYQPGGLHSGCLWIGYGSPGSISVVGNSFSQCMTYDIHVDNPFTPNITITGNTFAVPKDAIRAATDFTAITSLSYGWADIQVKCLNSETVTGFTLTRNTFTNGYDLDYGGCSNPSYSGLVINSNTIPGGAPNNPSQPQP